jgi:RecB family exonuclease
MEQKIDENLQSELQRRPIDVNNVDTIQLSVSSVELFTQCKAKWYYRYILELPQPPTYHTILGSYVHKLLEIFLRRYKKKNDLNDAKRVAIYLANKDQVVTKGLTDSIRREGNEMLSSLVNLLISSPEQIPDVIAIEKSFVLKLDNNINIRGYIDRIDRVSDSEIKIVDYKTNSRPEYLKQFQLATYSLALQQAYPDHKITACYQLIRFDHQSKQFEITDDDRKQVIEKYTSVAAEIRELIKQSPTTPWEPTCSKFCGYCPYKIRCELERTKGKSLWEIDDGQN